MKQKLLKTMLLLSALVVGLGNAWAGDVTYDFTAIDGFSTWGTSYVSHSVTYDEATVTFTSANHQTSTITNQPVTKGGDVNLVMKEGYTLSAVTFACTKWGSKAQTITLKYSTDGGDSYSLLSPSVTSTTFTISSSSLPEGTNAVKISFSSSANQVGIASASITYATANPGACATPAFKPTAGPVARGTEVTISCATDGATIYYTTDETTPTSSSTPYNPSSKPSITTSTTIKAIAVKDGLEDSEVATAAYTIAKVAAPVFSPEEGEVDKDSEITITCDTEGATIYYTTDGSEPTASSTAYNAEAKPTIDTDKTIKAIAIKANYIDSDVSSASYTYARVKSYNLVTSVSQIVSGKHYLIANAKEGSVVVMDAQKSNNRDQKTATFSGSTLQAKSAREFIIQGPDKNGWYAIYDAVEDGYLYAASSGSNNLKTGAYISDSPFSIAIDGTSYEANIVGKGKYTRNIMRYNSTNNLFSCYGSGQNPIYLFELDGEETPTESVEVTSAGYATYASDNALDFTGKSIEAYYATTKGDGTGVEFTRIYKVPAREGVLLHADGGATVDIPSLAGGTSADAVTGNKFVKGTGSNVATDGTTVWNYILNNVGGNIGFYKANGQKVAKNRAYLSILKSESASIKEFFSIDFEDDADGLEGVQGVQDVQGAIYNLAGQRISKMQKGINIVNGKKIIVK